MSQPLYHWRRHDGELDTVHGGTVETQKGDFLVAASACGRLVFAGSCTRNPTEATCPECQRIAAMLEFDEAQLRIAAKTLVDAFKP